ncbi:hypothetical protein WJX72_005352 [[Myrmecia] bisecta]|uniref:tRNA-5-taurinomethyluridine 2-sulfurtransferase n=1 Tax=[Myrmecia] bisecta TaxID=41462 RepID=A0AAW1NZB8_9CHLO
MWLEDVVYGALAKGVNKPTVVVLNVALVSCIFCLVCLLAISCLSAPALAPHVGFMIFLATALTVTVNWFLAQRKCVTAVEIGSLRPYLARRSMASAAKSAGAARGKTVAVAVSGGVDSAVAAMLLKQQGHDVVGVFMRNWDEGEETGNGNCSVEQDCRDAQRVCRHLDLPFYEADFVERYWHEVFLDFVAQCGRGLTPNPDLPCNRRIKFDALRKFAEGLGADTLATGHYARLAHSGEGKPPLLLRGVDSSKDQSYFLASVHGDALRNVLFPLGALRKADVRSMAAEAGLAAASRRSSAGICFIGRRNFGDFISQYVAPMPGRFVEVGSGCDLGPCAKLAAITHGQRAGIGGAADRMYVVGKDVPQRIVYVARGGDHAALFTNTALLHEPHWISGAAPVALMEAPGMDCSYKARYRQEVHQCEEQGLEVPAACLTD